VVSFLLAFSPISYMQSSSPHSCYMPCPSHPPWLDHSNIFGEEYKLWSSSCSFLQPPVTSSVFGPNILSPLFLNTLSTFLKYIHFNYNRHEIHDSSSAIVTRLRAGRPKNEGSIPDSGKRFSAHAISGAHPMSYRMGTETSITVLILWVVKRPGLEADHLH
jgi:hypothetical protein